MGTQDKHTDTSACIHCGKCQSVCMFLDKYKLHIGDAERLRELAYHCFLCGKCTEVCPTGIDGRQVIWDMRKKQVQANGGRLSGKGYGMLLWEKKDYRFRNYRNGKTKSVLFPGCNFPSFYPETTRYLSKLLYEQAGIGSVYDCCGKPVSELGLEAGETQILEGLDQRLRRDGVEELILLCPNCYAFLQGHLSVRMTSIYDKLRELGLGQTVSAEGELFLPCPDREKQELLAQIRPFLSEEPQIHLGKQCCGLGGCAGIAEPDLARKMAQNAGGSARTYTYCASCSGNLIRAGHSETEHLLVKILGRNEMADTKHSLLNRMKMKYIKEKRK